MTNIKEALKMRRVNAMRDRLNKNLGVRSAQAEALRLHHMQVYMGREEVEAAAHRHTVHTRIGEQQNASLESIALSLEKFLSLATEEAANGLAGPRRLTPSEIALTADKLATAFVGYQFPAELYVDGGLSLRPGAKVSGTNLLTHAQSKDMFMYLLVAIEGK
jgi:hypothetical protein